MKPPETPMMRKRRVQRIGLYVLIALVVFEILDFVTARLTNGSVLLLLVLAAINAAVIVQYFMHIGELFAPEEETH
jgi:heme/copper-type cytochrome/quinol oxidase subunit 4